MTGANGQLGWDVAERLAPEHDVVRYDKEHMDLTKTSAIGAALAREEPDLIIHCGAYTLVDKAEEERELCHAINAEATRAIAAQAAESGARLIYVSTDYVFDGTKRDPYETDDPPHPINHYGQTKLGGESAIKDIMKRYQIVRTSWVFGSHGSNFVKTMVRLGKERETLRVVADQVGSPTYTVDLAGLMAEMVGSECYGTYHATNEGFCSWHQFAAEIMRMKGWRTEIEAIASADYPTKALRPKNSRLSKRSLDDAGFRRLPTWQDALARYMREMKEA